MFPLIAYRDESCRQILRVRLNMTTSNDQITRQVLTRISLLITKGLALGTTVVRESDDPDWDPFGSDFVDWGKYSAWNVQCTLFLDEFLGPDHLYTQTFHRNLGQHYNSGVVSGCEILETIREDVQNGYLAGYREKVRADVFDDFLEMAEYLLSDGFKDPGAVLAGGVLEEHLRNLCVKHGVDTEIQIGQSMRPKKSDRMNADLAKMAVYSGNEQKQVTAWLAIRNSAAHAKYNEYSGPDVEYLLRGLRSFLSRYPA